MEWFVTYEVSLVIVQKIPFTIAVKMERHAGFYYAGWKKKTVQRYSRKICYSGK